MALVYNNEPILGIIYAPVLDELYYAMKGFGCYLEKNSQTTKLSVSSKSEIKTMTLVKSRSHSSEKLLNLVEKQEFSQVKSAGSSLKGCMIAKGEADIYYRFGDTNEWDICAMDIIIREAGGMITDLKGKPLKYNKKSPLVQGFLASNGKLHGKLLEMIR